MGDDHVRGMAEAAKQAEAGLKLFKEEEKEFDVDGATKFKAEVDLKINALDEEINGLSGKDNKKAKTEKQKELKALKDTKEYIDAEKVVKGKEPQNGFWIKKTAGVEAPVEEGKEEKEEDKKVEKDKKDKSKKSTEGAGISPAERAELEKIKTDIISRKKELKDSGMSGGQMNKDEQIVEWVKRMNDLKEKESPGSTTEQKKDEKKSKKSGNKEDDVAVAAMEKEVEEYRTKLQTEFKYSAKEIKTDPDMMEMTEKLNKLKGNKK